MAFILLVGGGLLGGQVAHADDPTAVAVKEGLTSFAQDGLGKLGLPVNSDTADHLYQLSQALPLSSLDPTSPSGLDLANVLKNAVKNAGVDSLNDLTSTLNGVNKDVGSGVSVTLGTGKACAASPCAAAGEVTMTASAPYTLTVPFDATKTVHVPLRLPTDVTDLSGPGGDAANELGIDLELKGTLTFAYNPAGATGEKFYLVTDVGGTSLTLTAKKTTAASTVTFQGDLGFTRVTAGATLDDLNVSLAIKLISPHGVGDANAGRITEYDWLNSQPQDLISVTRSGTAAATFTLDSDLVGGSGTPDLTFRVSGTLGIAPGAFTPSYQLVTGGVAGAAKSKLADVLSGPLADFRNVTPGDVLSGFGQLAATLGAIQSRADVHLPFLQGGVASTLDMISQLAQMLAQQTVTCGTVDGAPPSGSLYGLKKDTPIFCRATTTDTVKAGSVKWSPLAETATSVSSTTGSDANGTIAIAPTKSAQFKTAKDYVPPVIGATYLVDGTSTSKGVSQPIPTAQELFDALVTQAGFLSKSATIDVADFGAHLPASLTYDPATKVLRFHLLKTFTATDNKTLETSFDFGDRLKDSTGLFGLSPDSGAKVSLKAGKAVIDVTFGVILASDSVVAAATPVPKSRSFLDRFFVERSSDGTTTGKAPLLAIEDTSVDATLNLKGQVGFIGISAAGDATACGGGTKAFCLGAADATKPLVALNLVDQTNDQGGSGSGGTALGITVGGSTIPDAISLPVLLPSAVNHLAIVPNVRVSGGLTVSAKIGTKALASGGVKFDWLVKSMSNLTKPKVVTTGTEATDTDNLLIAVDDGFKDGLKQFYEMAKSDPQALLRVILDALSTLADQAATSGGGAFDTQLPLVKVTPRQLLVQFQQLKSAIEELSGGGSTLTTCVITAPAEHKTTPASAAVAGDTLQCNATYPNAAKGVAWTASVVYTNNTDKPISVGTTSIPPGAGWAVPLGTTYVKNGTATAGTAAATVATATPTDSVEFTLPAADPTSQFTGFQVHVDFDDSIGHHSSDLPAKPAPSTLQGFRDWLAGKLGLDPAVLTFDLVDAPDANNASKSVKTLKIGLKYDVCTIDSADAAYCAGGATKQIEPLDLPLNLDLGDLDGSGLSPSLTTTGTISLKFKAHAQLDVGIPLGNLLPTSTSDGDSTEGQCAAGKTGDACKDTTPLFEVFSTTGASVEARADGAAIGGTASLGPLTLSFGTSSPARDGAASDTDPDAKAKVGKVHMGGQVTVGVPQGASDPKTYTLGGYASAFSAAFTNTSGADSSCGSYDSKWSDNLDKDPADAAKTKDPTGKQDVKGTVCALFTLGLNDAYLGDLGMSWDAFKPASDTGSSFHLFVDKAALVAKIKSQAFSLNFLLKTLPQLLDSLQAALSNGGGTGDNKMPVVGNALDGGAKVVETINNGVKTVIDGIDKYVGDATTPTAMRDRGNEFLFLQFASADQVTAWGHAAEDPYKNWPQAKLGLLLDSAAPSGVDPADVGMKLTCSVWVDAADHTKGKKDADCATDSTAGLTDIQSALVDMRIGKGIPTGGIDKCADEGTTGCVSFDLPFDAGLDGFPLKVSGKVVAHVGWSARLNFGISRKDGPFVMVNHGTGSTPDQDVKVGASVTLGAATGSCAKDSTGQDQYIDAVRTVLAGNGLPKPFPFSKKAETGADNCLSGTIGFLTVSAQDTNGDDASKGVKHTGISLNAGVTFVKKGVTTYTAAGTPLGLKDIGSFSAKLGVSAEANVNLMLRAGVDASTAVGFPAVYGVFHAHWEWAKSTGAAPVAPASKGPAELSMSQVYIDAGGLLNAYLKPIVEQVKKSTSPFKPVVDTLYTPIPVVSQLAAMVGKPPVTLIDLAEALSGNDLTMIKTIIGVIKFANEFQPSGDAVLIPMGNDTAKKYDATGAHFLGGGGGYFGLDTTLVKTPQTQASAGQLVKDPVADKTASNGTGGLGDAVATKASGQLPASSAKLSQETDAIDGTKRWVTFGVAGLDIPLLRDPSLAFQVLMGQDVTLVDYQFGGLHAQAGFSYTFGPFMVGPVPVSITIGGSVQVNGHLGIGYDTTGLRAVIGGGSPYRLLDGLFFDTYDAAGRETPVLQLIGTISAGAQVDLVVVKAGIEAVLKLTINFFWDDPTPDGKMAFQDIGNKIANPICLFRVNGSLDAFLNAFVEFDFFLYSHKFSFTILKLHLLDFEGKCSPPSPEPAHYNGSQLVLNIGSDANRKARHISEGEHEEQAIVRMLPPPAQGGNGKQVSVAMFGAYKEYGDYNSAKAEHLTSVYADGDDKADDIELQPGSATAGTGTLTDSGKPGTCTAEAPCLVPFTLAGSLHGGTEADTLIGGEGGNFLDGGPGADKITGGIGDDLIQGGGDADTADGGRGVDKLCSGTWASGVYADQNRATCTAGTTSVVFSGGPGGDVVVGSTEGDQLDGGPGLDPDAVDPDDATSRTFSASQPDGVDGGDSLVGNLGNDAISAGAGNDDISGNTAALFGDYTCTGTGTAPVDPATDDDVIDAGPGNDKVWGGPGVDQLKTGTGAVSGPHDFACGGAGDDVVTGDPTPGAAAGDDTLFGGADRDLVTGGAGKDYVDGGSGNDKVVGADNDDDVLGGTGRDVVIGGVGDDLVIGESADVTEYDAGTGVAAIGHTGTAKSFSTKASKIDDTKSSGSVVDCITTPSFDPTKDTGTGNEDCVVGGPGKDAMYGGGGRDTMTGDDGVDWMSGGSNDDSMRGGLDGDEMYGDGDDDAMWGDSGADLMHGGADQDTMHGGLEPDYMEGNAGADTMFGDQNDDRMIGGSASATADDAEVAGKGDTLTGGAGNDVLLGDNGTVADDRTATMTAQGTGTYGGDRLQGDDGEDQLYGEGGGDRINGGTGADWLLGDHGSVSVIGSPIPLPGGASDRTVTLVSPDTGDAGDDTMHGDADVDHLYGGGANDTMNGDAADDYLEGNGGADSMYGDAGQDDLLGGSSSVNHEPYLLDVGETTMQGGAGQDVMLGDNGGITRTVHPTDNTLWLTDPITGGAARTVVLTYANEPTCTVDGKTVCGGDAMQGNDGNDRLYGEGGDDTVHGNADNDYVEGNQDGDHLFGDDGEDDLTGGSAEVLGAGDDATGRPDSGDTISGGADADVIAGDNAVLTKAIPPATGADVTNRPGMSNQRTVRLLDLRSADPATYGHDLVDGDAGVDVVFGQRGDDRLRGGTGADYVEAGQGTDWVEGNDGDDDLIGGSAFVNAIGANAPETRAGLPDAGDKVFGGADNDLLLGDNGIITRLAPLTDVVSKRLVVGRHLELLDLSNGGLLTAASGRSGDDQLSGGSGADSAFGQDGSDRLSGGSDDDYQEGNGGPDRLWGDQLLSALPVTEVPVLTSASWPGAASDADTLEGVQSAAGQDDQLGGSSLPGFRDEADQVHGDGASDFQLGDNGTIRRDIVTKGGVQSARVYELRYAPAATGKALVRISDPAYPSTRFCVTVDKRSTCEVDKAYGNDLMWGDGGDDFMYGQDGDDTMRGGSEDDDMYGELGDDLLYGEAGDDAILGDRGGVRDVYQAAGNTDRYALALSSVPKVEYEGFAAGTVVRVTDLLHDVNGDSPVAALMPYPGLNIGGVDRIRGGTDHDSIHAGFGDDLANGDSGGDSVFGDDGADVLWGGKGCDAATDTPAKRPYCFPGGVFDPAPHLANGETHPLVTDYLLGGKGGTSASSVSSVSASDILDWRPRGSYVVDTGCTKEKWPVDVAAGKKAAATTLDPCAWFEMTDITTADTTAYQHHQGVDWEYGGWDRDVMQADTADNGPNEGDRLLDWNGAYNLYTHCNSAYGGYNDVRQHSPAWQDFLQRWAWSLGAGAKGDVTTAGTSAYVELALVFPGADNTHGAGSAYASTPGHFDNPNACAP